MNNTEQSLIIDNNKIHFLLENNLVKIIQAPVNFWEQNLFVFIEEIKHRFSLSSFDIYFNRTASNSLLEKYDLPFYVLLTKINASSVSVETTDFELQELTDIPNNFYPFFKEAFKAELVNAATLWLNDFKQIQKTKRIFKIELDGETQAALLSFSKNDDWEYVFLLGVAERFRNRQLAQILMNKLYATFPNKKFVLGVSYKTPAYHFYVKNGFELANIQMVHIL